MGFPTGIKYLYNFEDIGLCFLTVNWRIKLMSHVTLILRIATIKIINKIM